MCSLRLGEIEFIAPYLTRKKLVSHLDQVSLAWKLARLRMGWGSILCRMSSRSKIIENLQRRLLAKRIGLLYLSVFDGILYCDETGGAGVECILGAVLIRIVRPLEGSLQ